MPPGSKIERSTSSSSVARAGPSDHKKTHGANGPLRSILHHESLMRLARSPLPPMCATVATMLTSRARWRQLLPHESVYPSREPTGKQWYNRQQHRNVQERHS